MSEWISASQTLPKYDEFVLVAAHMNCDYHVARLIESCGELECWRDGFGHRVNYVTHWQKIESPKEEKAK